MLKNYFDENLNFTNPWLDNLDYDWNELSPLGEKLTVPKHTTLFNQDEQSNYIYIVNHGRVRLSLISPDGEEKALAVIGSNGLLGECSLNESERYATNAITASVTDLIRIDRSVFIDHIEKNPKLYHQLLDLITQKYRLLCMHSMEISYTKALSRVCKAFIHLANEYGEKLDDGKIKLTITFTQQEMANLLGITRVSIANNIKYLLDSGYIKKDNRYYIIQDIEELYELSQST